MAVSVGVSTGVALVVLVVVVLSIGMTTNVSRVDVEDVEDSNGVVVLLMAVVEDDTVVKTIVERVEVPPGGLL